ncbi:hypothetical protein [Inquilinus limosus]|uniref:Uncharacterized protein n=1 Tax=Inquilinus limosus MP06 TaxID=1398085 RepID=A0A0A0DAE2_9PROT|nr:hypothetical protein [Inquilinus limosus]KGM35000.1 hypothetical protein P409_07080 [Inquilinus limosus MP06]
MAIPTVDEVWADFNADGSVKEPSKQDIRRLLRFIQAIAAANGMKTYPNKAAMDADLTQADGTPALLWADPVEANNYPTVWTWNDPTNQWIEGGDRISSLKTTVDLQAQYIKGAAGGVDGIYAATGAPRPVVFTDASSYNQTWTSISNPQTRFNIVPSDAGLEVEGLSALTTPWPVGIKMSWDLVPGDSYYFEGVYTAGSSFTQLGFWFGTDPVTSGDLSGGTRMVVYRDRVLIPCLANGITGDGSRTITPGWGATDPVGVGVVFGFAIDVLGDRSLRYKVYRNGIQQLVDVVVTPPGPAGALVVGLNIINGATGRITKLLRKTNPGKTIWIDNTVAASGDGSRGSPLKTVLDVPAYLAKIGYQDEITINWLSDDDYGYLQCKDTLAGKWNLNGRPGGRTRLNGYLQETVPWTVVPGTSGTVYSTPQKWGTEPRSQLNQPFVIGASHSPRPWFTFPDMALPQVVTNNGGVDMAGLSGGGFAISLGVIYIRLPDGLGPDPAAATVRLSRTHYVVEIVGGPEVNMNNLVLQYSSQHLFAGGSGRGIINNCEAYWSAYDANGFECQNGSYRFLRPKVKYIGNDGIGRTPRADISHLPYQTGVRQVIEIIDGEISHTRAGDGVSQHFNEENQNSCETRVINTWIHDCWKCGLVSLDDLMVVEGGVIERCGTAQLSLFGVTTASAAGRIQQAFVNGTVIDPQGLGTIGVQNLYTDGMALMRCDLVGVWIGTPAAGGGGGELMLSAQSLAGQTRDPSKNVLAYRNCVTERPAGSVAKVGGGTAGTFLPIAANTLI